MCILTEGHLADDKCRTASRYSVETETTLSSSLEERHQDHQMAIEISTIAIQKVTTCLTRSEYLLAKRSKKNIGAKKGREESSAAAAAGKKGKSCLGRGASRAKEKTNENIFILLRSQRAKWGRKVLCSTDSHLCAFRHSDSQSGRSVNEREMRNNSNLN